MDVKQAVETAKSYVGELFAEEGVVNLGLEEVVHDDTQEEWRVTLGARLRNQFLQGRAHDFFGRTRSL